MSRPNDDLEARLRGLHEPDLPAELKARVLAAAELAPIVTWRDRVWFSTRWRVAAAGLLVAVLAADRWTLSPSAPRATMMAPGGVAELEGLVETGSELGIPADTTRQLGARMEFAPLSARETRDQAEAAIR